MKLRGGYNEKTFNIFIDCVIIWVFFLPGCAPKGTLPVAKGYDIVKEKEWLKNAYRYDRNGWIFLHNEDSLLKKDSNEAT